MRNGVKWNDGAPLTAADVKFTFETQKYEGAQYGTMWKTGLKSVTTRGRTVTFHFRGTPNYQEWDSNRYTVPSCRDTSKGYSEKEIVSGNTANVRKASAPGRSSTAAASAASRRSSGTGVTAGGRRRRTG